MSRPRQSLEVGGAATFVVGGRRYAQSMSLIDRAEARRKSALAAMGPPEQVGSSAGLVYVYCFPARAVMRKFLADLAWETEAWCDSDPTHMIHLNGDKCVGPHAVEAS